MQRGLACAWLLKLSNTEQATVAYGARRKVHLAEQPEAFKRRAARKDATGAGTVLMAGAGYGWHFPSRAQRDY